MEEPVPYQAHLIRLWPTKHRGVAEYRVTLESVTAGQRQSFPNLDRLVAFLRAQGEEWRNQERRQDGSDRRTGWPAL
jgi:hypothetical protein